MPSRKASRTRSTRTGRAAGKVARYVAAIDQGTTGSTALVVDEQGRVRARAYSEFTQYFPKPGWVEHDAEEIWRVSDRKSVV